MPRPLVDTTTARWSRLIAVVGGASKLAAKLRVSRKALYTWRTGDAAPSAASAKRIVALASCRDGSPSPMASCARRPTRTRCERTSTSRVTHAAGITHESAIMWRA